MQTISIQVQDNFMQKFLNFVKNHKENITITKDKNLDLDPYFYERQKQLQQDIDEVDSGKSQMISNDDFWNDIDKFTLDLQK